MSTPITDLPEPLQSAVRQITRRKVCYAQANVDRFQLDSCWHGGSQNVFYAVDLRTGGLRLLEAATDPFKPMPTHQMVPGEAVVVCGTSCGKLALPIIRLHQADALALTCQAVEVVP